MTIRKHTTAAMRAAAFLGWVCVMELARGGGGHPPTRVLSLRECIDLALENNLDVQIERYTPQIARFTLEGSYGAYDPLFNVGASRQSVAQPSAVDPKKPGPDYPYELQTDSVGPGISGLLPTGLRYDLGARADFLDLQTVFSASPDQAAFYPGGIRITNQAFASAGITVRQPLLRDFWIDPYRQRIRINRRNVSISDLALRWRVMNTVAAVQSAYYELMFARENVKVQEQALGLARELYTQTRRRVQVGDLPPLDEKQAESQVESSQTDLFAAQQALAERQNALKNLLTDDFQAWTGIDLEPAETLVALPERLDLADIWRTAVRRRPDLQQFRLELEKQDMIVRYRFNQLFPRLDLVAGYSGVGLEGGLGGALSDLADRRNPSYEYGVVLSVPLGNRAAHGNYRASRAARNQSRLELKRLEQSIQVQIDDGVKRVRSAFQRVTSARLARQYAEVALDAEQKKLQNGTTTSFFVLDFQRRLTAARTAEVRALADYQVALARLALDEGVTLERNRLSLEIK